MQFTANQAPPQERGTAKPYQRTATDGSVWVLHGPTTKKPYRVYPPGENITSSNKFRAATEEEAAQAFARKPQGENDRPPIFDMDDEELASSGNVHFDAEQDQQPINESYTNTDRESESEQEPATESHQSQKKGPDYSALLAASIVRPTEYIPAPEIALVIERPQERRIIATLGNISAVTGKAKAKKTFAVTIGIAAAVGGEVVLNSIKGELPPGQNQVLVFDTEQSKYHVLKVVKRICTLCGVAEPENLTVFSLREYAPDVRLALIDHALKTRSGVGLVVIDGIRDLAIDPILDAGQSSHIITSLLKWSTYYNIHILTVLHQNKTDGNSRGHIGTELNNKAETVITVTKDPTDGDISIIAPEHSRGDRDFVPFAFSINDQGLPYLVEDWQPTQRPTTSNARKGDSSVKTGRPQSITASNLTVDQHVSILRKAFDGVSPGKFAQTYHRIKAASEYFGHKIGDNKAKEFMTHYQDQKWLVLIGGIYSLNLPDVDITNSPTEESGLI